MVDFGDITRLLDLFARVLIPGDGKQIRVQFCCETFLPRYLLTLKHSHHFYFCLKFHDPFNLCRVTVVMALNSLTSNCLAVNISYSFFFLPYEALLILFSPLLAYLLFQISIYLSDSLPPVDSGIRNQEMFICPKKHNIIQ